MKTLSLLIFTTTITYIQSSQEQTVPVIVGGSHTVYTNFDGARDYEGIKRNLFSEQDPDKWQYFYFCDRAKGDHKNNCGAWVDENGTAIQGASNNLQITEDGGEILDMQLADSGSYTRVPENPDPTQAILERVKVFVQEGPKPPPPPPSQREYS